MATLEKTFGKIGLFFPTSVHIVSLKASCTVNVITSPCVYNSREIYLVPGPFSKLSQEGNLMTLRFHSFVLFLIL